MGGRTQSYYGLYGGAATTQYPIYGTGPGGMVTGAAAAAAFYPYLQFGEGSGAAAGGAGAAGAGAGGYSSSGQAAGYGVQYPHHHHLFQYSTGAYPQHYGAPMSLSPSPALQSGL